jgi:hypothetical protein
VEMILIFFLFISIVKICDFLHLCKSVRFFVRFFGIHVLVVVSAGLGIVSVSPVSENMQQTHSFEPVLIWEWWIFF